MSEQTQDIRLYGNWHRPVTPGIGRMSLGQTMAAFATAVVAVVVAQTAGLWWSAGIIAVVGAFMSLAVIRDKHGQNFMSRWRERRVFNKAKRRKENLYRSSVLAPSKRADGSCRLPGILGKTTLSEHEDAHRRRFAVIHHPDGRLTVAMALAPSGLALVDQETVDTQVAYFGMFLSDLSDMTGVVDVSVTVETVPDTGIRLRREVASRSAPDAPPVARQIVDAVVARDGASGAQIRAWATISFQPSRISMERRDRTSRAIRDIATRLPGLTQTLAMTGAGAVQLLTASELTRLARVAFDPDVEALLDDMALSGVEMPLDWSQCGPVGAEAAWDSYRHDSGLSRSWVMSAPPRSTVQSNVLSPLLDVNPDVERKRVTFLYRPMESSKAPDVVERDVDKAVNAIRTSRRPTERKVRAVTAARQRSREEADGAALIDFGCIVTATVSGTSQDAARRLADASAAVESRAAASRLLIRRAYGAQDSAFALGLPLGLTPARATLTGGW